MMQRIQRFLQKYGVTTCSLIGQRLVLSFSSFLNFKYAQVLQIFVVYKLYFLLFFVN